jgi:uncharacterized linocin/CFP29 family protein
MDILKRTLAPITDEAWLEIDAQATRILTAYMSARKVVGVTGPMGGDFAGVPEGRLQMPDKQADGGVKYGVRKVHQLIETRNTFNLDIWELDNVVRGAKDIDLENLEEAARQAALFEEKVIFHGFPEANIKGLREYCVGECPVLGDNPDDMLTSVAQGLAKLTEKSIEGPYSFIVGPKIWSSMSAHIQGYPVKMQVENLLGGGQVVLSPYLDGEFANEAYLISTRGGDMEIILGQDISVGYESHDSEKVKLYFSESFTFRVLEPAAFIHFHSA